MIYLTANRVMNPATKTLRATVAKTKPTWQKLKFHMLTSTDKRIRKRSDEKKLPTHTMNKIIISKNTHQSTAYITWVKKNPPRQQSKSQLPRAIAIDGELYVHHGKRGDNIVRREIIKATTNMLGRRNDGYFDTMRIRDGKPTTRKRLFRKINNK